jgi:hypothetical protein
MIRYLKSLFRFKEPERQLMTRITDKEGGIIFEGSPADAENLMTSPPGNVYRVETFWVR